MRVDIGRKAVVGILALDRPITTEKCIRKIALNSHRFLYDLVIIDNNATPQVKEVIKKYSKDVDNIIVNPFNAGCAFGVNQFMAVRRPGQHVMCVNVDAHVLTDDWFSILTTLCGIKGVGIVGGRRPEFWVENPAYLDTFKHSIIPGHLAKGGGINIFVDLWDNTSPIFVEILKFGSVLFPFTMMSSQAIDEVGYMNEALCIDDINYCARVQYKGLIIMYAPQVVITQPQTEPRGHDQYGANQEMVSRNYRRNLEELDKYSLGKDGYCGTRFLPETIKDEVYKVKSDENWEFFRTWRKP